MLAKLLIGMILIYRGTLGLFLGGHCRYWPTCSQYAIDAIRKYGPVVGTWRSIKRVCRCHPFRAGGHDPA